MRQYIAPRIEDVKLDRLMVDDVLTVQGGSGSGSVVDAE